MKYLKSAAKLKIYFDRSGTYIGYIQFMMMVFVFMKEYHLKVTMFTGTIALIAVIILRVVIGWLDMEIIIGHELQKGAELNPWNMDVSKKLNDIHEKICD